MGREEGAQRLELRTTTTEKEAFTAMAVFFLAIAILIAIAYGVSKLIPAK